jgi:hypothetical protein
MVHPIDLPAHVNARPIRAEWWMLPLWSALGGIWAFSRTALTESTTDVAIAIALVAGGWQPLWHIATHTVWNTALSRWKNWTQTLPVPAWPYVQPGTVGSILNQRVAQARSWWREVGRKTLTQPLSRGVLALLISLLLGAALGRVALLLTLGFMALAELAALWHEGSGQVGALWEAIALVGVPWLLGASLREEVVQGALPALVLTLAAALYAHNGWWSVLGPALGAAFLVWQGEAFTAGWLLLSALPGLIVLAQRPTDEAYRSVAGFSILAMVALMAAVL